MIKIRDIPQDMQLPQLTTVLDTDRMCVELKQALFRSCRSRVTDCEIEWIKYRPRQDCRVAYRLTLEDEARLASITQIVYGRALPHGGALSRYQRGCQNTLIEPRVGLPIAYMENLDMVVWSFPNDRKLDNLPTLIDPTYITGHAFPRLLAMRNDRPKIRSWQHELVHYVPEQTCMIRVICDLECSTGSTRETYYAKAYYNSCGDQTYSVMNTLWAIRDRLPAVTVAQPCFYDAHHRILWQRGLPGEPFVVGAGADADISVLFQRAGEALAAFHQTKIALSQYEQPSDPLVQMRQTAHFVAAARPSSYVRLVEMLRRLIVELSEAPPNPMATLHGDLHPKNFLVQSQQLALIDLDSVRRGSPCCDLGSFFASDLFGTLVEGRCLEAASHRITRCLESYRSHMPWDVPMRTLRWHTSYALIAERVARCITRLKAGRMDLIDDLIELSEAILCRDAIFPHQ